MINWFIYISSLILSLNVNAQEKNKETSQIFCSEEYDPGWNEFDWDVFNHPDAYTKKRKIEILEQSFTLFDTPFSQACWMEDFLLVKKIIDFTPQHYYQTLLFNKNRFDVIPVMQAIGSSEIIEYILNFFPQFQDELMEYETPAGENLLRFAIYEGNHQIVSLLLKRSPKKMMTYLLKTDIYGVTSFHYAIIKKQKKIILQLLQHSEKFGYYIAKQVMNNGISALELAKTHLDKQTINIIKSYLPKKNLTNSSL